MTTDPPEPKARRKWHFYKWLVLLIVATSAFAAWNAFAFRSALKEAKALGWHVIYTEPYAEIRKDWKNAFKKDTWLDGVTWMGVPTGEDLEKHRAMILQLNPRGLTIHNGEALRDFSSIKGLSRIKFLCGKKLTNLTNVEALKNLTTLRFIILWEAIELTNVSALNSISELKRLHLSGCTALKNVDELRYLPELFYIDLSNCTALTNVDGLKHLTTLREVRLFNCTGLTNADALKNHTALGALYLSGCSGLTKEYITILKGSLPKTKVQD